jgi:hypothetical protein
MVDGNLEDAMFLTLLSKLNQVETPLEKFSVYEDEWLPVTDTTAASATAAAETIQVTTIAAYIPRLVYKNKRTGELIYVKETNNSGYITVERGVGYNSTDSTGTAAAAMNSGDTLIRLSPAVGETNKAQVFQSTIPSEIYNYAQKFRWDIAMTEDQRKSKHVTGRDWNYYLDKAMKQARKDLNGTFYDGERDLKTINGERTRLTGGLDFFIETNIHASSGTLHEYQFNNWLDEYAMKHGSMKKTLLASSRLRSAITEIAGDRITHTTVNMGNAKLTLGIGVSEYLSPSGKRLSIVEDRYLTESQNGNGYIVDFSDVRLRHFSGDGISGQIGIKEYDQEEGGSDSKAKITGDLGLDIGPEKLHGKITGVMAGAKGRAVM